MRRPRRNRSLVIALYANAGLLLAILVALLSRGGSASLLPSAGAAAIPQPIAGNGSLYIMPCQLLSNVWGCYVLDLENETLSTYSWSGDQLRLKAARSIKFDHQLRNFNTFPDPDDIRKMIELDHGKHAPPATQPELNK
jgi:hypothetical protein